MLILFQKLIQKHQVAHREDININKRAFTLFEILVSVIILALVITGLANVFVAGKKYIKHSRLRISGGELGKKFLDPLQIYVRQDTWSTNPLGTNNISLPAEDGFTPTYVTSTLPGANIKKVKVTVTWPAEVE